MDKIFEAKCAKIARKTELIAQKTELARLEAKRIGLISTTVKPGCWQMPQPASLECFLKANERWKLKVLRSAFMRKCPGLKRWSIERPLYYMFIFFDNKTVGIKAVQQDWNGTLGLTTRTFQINPNKIWGFGNDSAIFYNADSAEPLDVCKGKLEPLTINPEMYKLNMENQQLGHLYHLTEGLTTNKIMLYIVIGIAVILLILLAKQMGWLNG